MKGFATPEGTAVYKSKFTKNLADDFFRAKNGLWFSSLGIGSYLGEPDEYADHQYAEALKEAVLSGINVIDSAINYRCQRSERAFGKALKELFETGQVKRDELILCTKGGFLPFDGKIPASPVDYLKETYIQSGLLKAEEIVEGCHALSPKYLEDQLNRSLSNLGVETIDIYYLHNPEMQLSELEQPEFLKRMRDAFEWLEKKVAEGKIKMYGTATWNGYRVAHGAADYLSIEELLVVAREVAGPDHHFKVVQLPFNLAMPEAWIFANQSYGAALVPFLGMAHRLELIIIGSATLLQSRLTAPLPDFLDPYFKNLPKPSQRSIQFARSVPGMTTSLIGMKTTAHVKENMEVAKVSVLSESDLFAMFQKS
jgi:aryl-alcohol dehydrogenase-like predicted oxidoreductase